MFNFFRKKPLYMILPAKVSNMSYEEFKECQECMKKNEELGIKVFDCEEECNPEDKFTIQNIRIPLSKIDEYYPINEEECWIKSDENYGRYNISAKEMDRRLGKYVKFI